MRHGDILNPDTRSGAKARAANRRKADREKANARRFRNDPEAAAHQIQALTRDKAEIAKENALLKRILADAGIALILPAATGASMYDVDNEMEAEA